MKKLLTISILLLCTIGFVQAQTTMTIYATSGNLNEIIAADTLANGTQAHDVYELVSLDTTYKYTDAIITSGNMKIVGVVDPSTGRPPCVQPAVLQDFSIPPTFLTINGAGAVVTVENLYLLAYATNNSVNGGGVAINVTADEVRLIVNNSVFDGWQTFGIGYNGNWDDFYLNNNVFRNFVHPNQHYIGEVIRNTWPGEAYTDTLSMVGNTMLCVNGYAACPVTKYYETYFEFNENKVFYTFKNPFFIFNLTNGKINDNTFYGLYAGGVDTLENPWWDNLWEPDTTYGIIALQPLNEANAKAFTPDDSSAADFLAIAESKRMVEVMNNTYFWPQGLTDFWAEWNGSQPNTVRLPSFMNERTVAMFGDDTAWPGLVESNNTMTDPGYMATIDSDVLDGGNPDFGDVGLKEYFKQIRTGTASVDYWGYAYTEVGEAEDWVPTWPLPEMSFIPTGVEEVETTTVPTEFKLGHAYPNPFNPETSIEYTLSTAGRTNLKVYNVLGQEIMTVLKNQMQQAGTYKARIDMTGHTSGVYFVVLEQMGSRSVQKIMMMK
ncbi:T9SS type A sorting domain-containing protein [candidate division KSB1 bacterium]|nr:T9SS type A sorting domain-containing protein [candidate division KSB1 bacterium]